MRKYSLTAPARAQPLPGHPLDFHGLLRLYQEAEEWFLRFPQKVRYALSLTSGAGVWR